MRKRFTGFLLLLLVAFSGRAQDTLTTTGLRSLTLSEGKTPAETAVALGRQFLGKPYVPYTLDINPTEQLIVNLREFDCTTYLETTLALALACHDVHDRQNTPLVEESFRKYLTQLRYRDGHIDGYVSRLHYFSDWLRDNERKGLVSDVTHELPGSISVAKPVSYMTAATYKYPKLTDPAIFKQIAQTEASLSQLSFSFIPSKNIAQTESQLRDGDIIMLMAARPGLDMKHVGLAVRQPDGRIHLMHASSDLGEVMISSATLSEYLRWHKNMSGIRVARLRSVNVLEASAVNGK